jgi:hypothetical protein
MEGGPAKGDSLAVVDTCEVWNEAVVLKRSDRKVRADAAAAAEVDSARGRFTRLCVPQVLIRYTGWNSQWDEWIDVSATHRFGPLAVNTARVKCWAFLSDWKCWWPAVVRGHCGPAAVPRAATTRPAARANVSE